MEPDLWGFMAEPTQNVLNGLHPRLGKLVEIGTIYTTVAGLLNILAIYDAFEGPAYLDAEEPAGRTRPRPRLSSPSVGARKGSRREARHDSPPRTSTGSSCRSSSPSAWFTRPRGMSHGQRIWIHSLRLCLWILGILVGTTALLLLINTQV